MAASSVTPDSALGQPRRPARGQLILYGNPGQLHAGTRAGMPFPSRWNLWATLCVCKSPLRRAREGAGDLPLHPWGAAESGARTPVPLTPQSVCAMAAGLPEGSCSLHSTPMATPPCLPAPVDRGYMCSRRQRRGRAGPRLYEDQSTSQMRVSPAVG